MLFNSFEFIVFLPIVFLLYWFVFNKSRASQNAFLLIVSYIFYSFWDWRFSFLLAFSTILDFVSGLIIFNTSNLNKKRVWMRLSILINIGILCYFKYLNFFIESFKELLLSLQFEINTQTLEIILPIGISFYTFHGISYVMDIYYGRIAADKNIVDYSLFVSFFPLLVAGPIERATHLLPQLKRKKEFNYKQAVDGCRLILWGMFKKVVIADSLAQIVDGVFNNFQNESGLTLAVAIIAFSFQVYGDFSGYTDIARGVSKLLGIELILNFNFPFFSKSIPEFWNRWHISLSSWLNDYVFTPLALNFRHLGRWGVFLAVFLTFTIAGLWHGANWNYIVYGMIHGICFIPYVFSKKGIRSISGRSENPNLKFSDIPKVLLTFLIFSFSLIFFRAESLTVAIQYISYMINSEGAFRHIGGKNILLLLLLILVDFCLLNGYLNFSKFLWVLLWIAYIVSGFVVYWYFEVVKDNFIYFQF